LWAFHTIQPSIYFNEARDDGVAAASAGPYANYLPLAADRQLCQYHSVFTGQMPFLPPNQQYQSTDGIIIGHQYNE